MFNIDLIWNNGSPSVKFKNLELDATVRVLAAAQGNYLISDLVVPREFTPEINVTGELPEYVEIDFTYRYQVSCGCCGYEQESQVAKVKLADVVDLVARLPEEDNDVNIYDLPCFIREEIRRHSEANIIRVDTIRFIVDDEDNPIMSGTEIAY